MFYGVPTQCIEQAAQRYATPPAAIVSLLRNEGGRPGLAVANTNGTQDLGPMQVNTSHLKFLIHYGYTYQTLRDDPCANVMAGTWIYARCLARTGGVLRAAACYNAGGRPWLAWQSGYVQRFAIHLRSVAASAPAVSPGVELIVEDGAHQEAAQ